jgi:hypothetical protein
MIKSASRVNKNVVAKAAAIHAIQQKKQSDKTKTAVLINERRRIFSPLE